MINSSHSLFHTTCQLAS